MITRQRPRAKPAFGSQPLRQALAPIGRRRPQPGVSGGDAKTPSLDLGLSGDLTEGFKRTTHDDGSHGQLPTAQPRAVEPAFRIAFMMSEVRKWAIKRAAASLGDRSTGLSLSLRPLQDEFRAHSKAPATFLLEAQ